ncbi:MAG: SsrA-binding protein SmpB [Candidatus Paceibacterota bacterium]
MTTYIESKRARFDYELLETFEAGISLLGSEVKSVRHKLGKLDGAHVVVRGNEAFLVGASIPAWQPANTTEDYDPERTRTLLLSQKELTKLHTESEKKGLTLIPIRLYNSGRFLKLELAIARGKKQFDKRETLKKRDTDRDLKRELKHQ